MVSLTLSPALPSCASGIAILISSLPLAFHAKGVDLTMCKKILNHCEIILIVSNYDTYMYKNSYKLTLALCNIQHHLEGYLFSALILLQSDPERKTTTWSSEGERSISQSNFYVK